MKNESVKQAVAVFKEAHKTKKPDERLKLFRQARYMLSKSLSLVESFKDKQEIKEKLSETLSALYSLELPEELKPAAIQRSDVQGECEDCMEFFYISERQLICSPGIHVFRCSKVKKGIGKRNYPRCFAVSREAIYVLKPLERQDFCILKWWRPLAELEGVSLVRGKQEILVFKFSSEITGEFEDVLEFAESDVRTVLDTVQNAQQGAPKYKKPFNFEMDISASDVRLSGGVITPKKSPSSSDGLDALEVFVQTTPISPEIVDDAKASLETLEALLKKYMDLKGSGDEASWEVMQPARANCQDLARRLTEGIKTSQDEQLKASANAVREALDKVLAMVENEANERVPSSLPVRIDPALRRLGKETEQSGHRRAMSLSQEPPALVVDLSKSAHRLKKTGLDGGTQTPGRTLVGGKFAEVEKKHVAAFSAASNGMGSSPLAPASRGNLAFRESVDDVLHDLRNDIRLSAIAASPTKSKSFIDHVRRTSSQSGDEFPRSSFDGDRSGPYSSQVSGSPLPAETAPHYAEAVDKGEALFQYVCAHMHGLLLEDARMRIGIKMHVKNLTGTYRLVFHNKCPHAMRINADIAPSVALEISQIKPFLIKSNQQQTHELTVHCTQPFLKPPIMHVTYDLEGIGKTHSISTKLPIVVSKFCVPLRLEKHEFFRQWKEGSHGEYQAVLRKSPFREVDGHLVATMLSSAANLEMLENIDADRKNCVMAAKWAGSTYHPCCLVRIESSPAAGLYRITVHSEDAVLSEAYLRVISGFMVTAKYCVLGHGQPVARHSSNTGRSSSDGQPERQPKLSSDGTLNAEALADENDPLEDKARLSDSAVPRTEKEEMDSMQRRPRGKTPTPARRSSVDGGGSFEEYHPKSRTLSVREEDELQSLRDIAGEYAIEALDVNFEEMIGKGSFGEVYRAEWDGRVVAAKLLRILESEAVREIGHEVSTLARLRHPCVVTYWGLMLPDKSCKDGGPGSSPAIILEYMSKGSLFDWLYGSPRRELEWSIRLTLLKDTANGMKHLHSKGIVHRDLKPLNLLLSGTKKHPQLKVADFGVSRRKTTRTHVATLTQAGTPAYMAPEVLEERETFGEKVDQYSFGIIMWELLVGQIPWTGLSMAQIIRKIVVDHARPEVPNPLPAGTPDDYVALMRECWDDNEDTRPAFSDVALRIRRMLDDISR